MATTGAVCLDSTTTFEVNSGLNANLPFNASDDENQKDFRVYRAQKNSIEFAHMTKDKSKGDCSGALSDLCVKGKVEFRRDNQTHLLLVTIFHTTINDSGQYAVWAKFDSGNLHPDEKTAKCLKVIHVKVEGKECIRVIFIIKVSCYCSPSESKGISQWGYLLFYSQVTTTLNYLRLLCCYFFAVLCFRSFEQTLRRTDWGANESFWLFLVTAMNKYILKKYNIKSCTVNGKDTCIQDHSLSCSLKLSISAAEISLYFSNHCEK